MSYRREARRQAVATEALAKEARLDRELSISPLVKGLGNLPRRQAFWASWYSLARYSQVVSLSNIGNGPAWHCVYLARNTARAAEWCWTILEELAVNRTSPKLTAKPGLNNVPAELFEPSPGGDGVPFYSVVFCRDILGNQLRFVPNRLRDISGPNDPSPPAWQGRTFSELKRSSNLARCGCTG